MPIVRTVGNPSAAWIFKWVIGAAIVGYDAVSSASSVAISPPAATIGVPYAGTITYSGGHAGEVVSMAVNSHCLTSSYTLAPGLTVTYSGGNTARVSGTPSGTAGTVGLTVEVTDGSGCGGGLTDTRATSLIVQNSGGGVIAPTMVVVPGNVIAQIGSDVILSGGASGNPTPSYFWRQGLSIIPGATNNTLLIPSVQLTNSGQYTLYASNSQNVVNSSCYLTVALTPGADPLALLYTNYSLAGTPLTMYSLITNVPAGVDSYSWTYYGNSNWRDDVQFNPGWHASNAGQKRHVFYHFQQRCWFNHRGERPVLRFLLGLWVSSSHFSAAVRCDC